MDIVMPYASYEDLYTAQQNGDIVATQLLFYSHWFISIGEFDHRSGEAMPLDLDNLLVRIRQVLEDTGHGPKLDRLSYIIDHCAEAVAAIIKQPKAHIKRSHAMLPVHAAREVDSRSIQWLSRRPGRNLRQKLSGKPQLMAVKRQASLDSAENRLLKAFLQALMSRLYVSGRHEKTGPEYAESELLQIGQRWLRSDEAADIAPWGYWPPNNTLLQEKNYRKVWDGWQWLQQLDEQVMCDHQNLEVIRKTVLLWSVYSILDSFEAVRLVQQPCLLDKNLMSIAPSNAVVGILYNQMTTKIGEQKIKLGFNKNNELNLCIGKNSVKLLSGQSYRDIPELIESLRQKVVKALGGAQGGRVAPVEVLISTKPVVVDLYAVRPFFSTVDSKAQLLPQRLLMQSWKDGDGHITVDCGRCRAISLTEKVTTLSMRSLFVQTAEHSTEFAYSAAMMFAQKLKSCFATERLTYLLPDGYSEFSLQTIRRAINAHFSQALPLPKSIATVFQWFNSTGKKARLAEGDVVTVIDRATAGLFATPLICRFSSSLRQAVPQSQGLYWERHPAACIDELGTLAQAKRLLDKCQCPMSDSLAQWFDADDIERETSLLSVIDAQSRWFHFPKYTQDAANNHQWQAKLSSAIEDLPGLRRNKKIVVLSLDPASVSLSKSFHHFEYVKNITEGAQHLARWQAKAGTEPLWQDHLPDLSIQVSENRAIKTLYLVRNATVTAQTGRSIEFPINETFILPKGQPYYAFPLHQGKGGRKINYQAWLKDKAFPLSDDTPCRLTMSYRYGADNPYELIFIPLNPAKAGFDSVTVQWREQQTADVSLLYPEFPKALSWQQYRAFPRGNDKPDDLLEWIEKSLEPLSRYRAFFTESSSDRICVDLTSADWFEDKKGHWCCKIMVSGWGKVFIHQKAYETFDKDAKTVSFDIEPGNRGLRARNITTGYSIEQGAAKKLAKSLRFPLLTVFNYGRSMTEQDVPDSFRCAVHDAVDNALTLLNDSDVPDSLKQELMFFLSCLAKDAPKQVVTRLLADVKDNEAIKTAQRPIAYAIGDATLEWQRQLLNEVLNLKGTGLMISIKLSILSVALWRAGRLIGLMSEGQLSSVCEKLCEQIQLSLDNLNGSNHSTKWRSLQSYCELLLVLLRTRALPDEQIKHLLGPKQPWLQKFTLLVEQIIEKHIESNFRLRSRIQISVNKPAQFEQTPNILYALKVYLTGDSGANTIEVLGVNEEDSA